MSITTARPWPSSKCASALRNASRASSSPTSTRTLRPVSCRTRVMNAAPFVASRTALVATASIRLAPSCRASVAMRIERLDREAHRFVGERVRLDESGAEPRRRLHFVHHADLRRWCSRRRRSAGSSSSRCRWRRCAGLPRRARRGKDHRDAARRSGSVVSFISRRLDNAKRKRRAARNSVSPPTCPVATRAGKCTAIVVPTPTALSARTVPPCASTRCFTIERPSPVPPSSRERPGSTR